MPGQGAPAWTRASDEVVCDRRCADAGPRVCRGGQSEASRSGSWGWASASQVISTRDHYILPDVPAGGRAVFCVSMPAGSTSYNVMGLRERLGDPWRHLRRAQLSVVEATREGGRPHRARRAVSANSQLAARPSSGSGRPSLTMRSPRPSLATLEEALVAARLGGRVAHG
jgi:hypothetical protein